MKHGRMEELKLGIKAGNCFVVVLAELPNVPSEIHAIKREAGIIKVDLGKGRRGQGPNRIWQPMRAGDIVRGTGEFAPVYTWEQLSK